MIVNSLKIYYEDDDIIVVHKPAFVASQSDNFRDKDMTSILKNHVFKKYRVRNPEIFVVHRLDKPVEGIMVYARNSKAAAGLSEQIRQNCFHKEYLAVTAGDCSEYEGKDNRIDNYLLKDAKLNMSKVVAPGTAGAKKSSLEFCILGKNKEGNSVMRVKLFTGRHHQIRVTMAELGLGLVGDNKYNEGEAGKNPELMSYKLSFVHPITKKEMSFIVDKEMLKDGVFEVKVQNNMRA